MDTARAHVVSHLAVERLRAFLEQRALGAGSVEIAPIGEGHSQLTYRVCRGELDIVLRSPPPRPLPRGAHDVLREAQVLRALEPTDVRAPRVLAVCADPSIFDVPFYLMERVHGEVLGAVLPAELDVPEQRRRIGEELIDALVELHACDYRAVGLQDLGKPEDYLARQITRMNSAWARIRARELPRIETVAALLAERRPRTRDTTLIHGDYRLGNVMYGHGAPARLVSILDWELCTLGDPLTDLGFLLTSYPEPGDADGLILSLAAVATGAGFPTRSELVARYERRSGRSAEGIGWYTAYATWRAAIILEGAYQRQLASGVPDGFFHRFEAGIPALVERAWTLCSAIER